MHSSNLQPSKAPGPLPCASEENLTSHREIAESPHDPAGSRSGMRPGWGTDPATLQLHLKESKGKATDVVAHPPLGSAQPSSVTKSPH